MKLKYDEPLSNFAFNDNLRRYTSGSFAAGEMLTGVVATPCYRAPEVVMSNGGYTGAMDVWALGRGAHSRMTNAFANTNDVPLTFVTHCP